MEAGISGMDSPRASDDVKARIRACPGCELQMNNVANAMRRHGSQMAAALEFAKTDLTEEQRQEIGASLAASLNEAQSAWDAYREHLIQHGLIPAE